MSDIRMSTKRRWQFDVLRTEDDTDWPESRPQPYSRVEGRSYRPGRVSLSFLKVDDRPVQLDSFAIYGPRIVKAGPVGAIVDEHSYSSRTPDEPWCRAIFEHCRAEVEKDLA